MAARLLVLHGPDQGRSFTLSPGQTIRVGRSTQTLTQLSDSAVSRVHFEISWQNDRPILTNRSSSGTAVNGARVLEHPLMPGDKIQFGKTEMQYQDSAEPETETPPVDLGVSLVGRDFKDYRILELLARGLRGFLFKAQDKRDRRFVALKILLPEISSRDEEVRRFAQAVKAMLPLKHPHLLSVYGGGRFENLCWVALQLVEGDNLARMLVRPDIGGKLPWQRAFMILLDLAYGLECLYSNRVLHRNLSPDNILIRRADQAALLGDPLFAMPIKREPVAMQSPVGNYQGDLTYLAPERVEGDPFDTRADLYSLGCSIYMAITGQAPYRGNSQSELIQKICWDEPEDPRHFQPDLPEEIRDVILKMMSKHPKNRPAHATELVEELEQIAKRLGIST